MTLVAIVGGVALIAFALWAMIGGGGSKPRNRNVHDQDVSSAIDLSRVD